MSMSCQSQATHKNPETRKHEQSQKTRKKHKKYEKTQKNTETTQKYC